MDRLSASKIRLGVCYYPEQWPESLWEDDLRRMRAHGLEVARVAEFAWSQFEPREGEYHFELFDHFLELAQRADVKVIFCTPTATPPDWLTNDHPEVLNASVDGALYRHGLRRHYSYNSETWREYTRKIVAALGRHYGDHPQIIGWQLDNELNCETSEFYSQADHEQFRVYLREKYGTLDNLNEKLGGCVWSQNYSDWEHIFLRRHTIGDQFNPHMLLEEKRFFSWSAVRYCRLQCETLRPFIGDRFITLNGIFKHLDYTQALRSGVDFLCYDSYPGFAFGMNVDARDASSLKDRKWSRSLTAVRSLSPRFGIMEQQSGATGWTGRLEGPMPKPGQMRLWTFQSIAHGADYVSYFRWRTAPCGTEIYWHGLNDYSNEPNERLQELQRIYADTRRLADVAGTTCQARVGYVTDESNEWDAELDVWHGRVERTSRDGWFAAAQLTHTPMDEVRLTPETTVEALSRYALLVYPHPVILTAATVRLLRAYAEQGGRVLLGARTGYKDESGRCPMRPMPGEALALCGARVTSYTLRNGFDDPPQVDFHGAILDAPVFNDTLEPVGADARVEAVYAANENIGRPAMTARRVGRGEAVLFGAAFTRETAMALLRHWGLAEPYADALTLPEGCELTVRSREDEDFLFVLNYEKTPQTLTVRTPMVERLSGEAAKSGWTLEPYGVAVFTRQR